MPGPTISEAVEWRPIAGFSNYAVSSEGEVYRVLPGIRNRGCHIMKPLADKDGYFRVCLVADDRIRKTRCVHILVLTAFRGSRPSLNHEAAHGDGDNQNNRLSNLRWATRSQNWSDRFLHGTDTSGSRHPCSKLSEDQVVVIREELARLDRRSCSKIAKQYGVSTGLIGHIKRGANWKHIL